MPVCTILVGIAGSGKTTQAVKIPGTRVSMDDLRKDKAVLHDTAARYAGGNERLKPDRRAEDVLVREAMGRGEDVVIDGTNLTVLIRRTHVERAAQFGHAVRCVFMATPYSLALKRNASRPEAIPESGIADQSTRLEKPDLSEGFESIRVIFPTE